MIRCFHCKRFLPEFPGTRPPEDTFPVSHACVIIQGTHSGVGGKTYETRVVPYVAPANDADIKHAAQAKWDLGTSKFDAWTSVLTGVGRFR